MYPVTRTFTPLALALCFNSSSVYAACSVNEVEFSSTEVECKDGFDFAGVWAGGQSVSNISVVVRSDGGIQTGGDAIRLNGDSTIEISGLVSSGGGIGVRLSGRGSQSVLVNGFGEVLGRTYGIYAAGGDFGTEGFIDITNFGLIGGPLNTGAIFAAGNRDSQVQNFGRIAVSGSGYGIHLSGSGGAQQLNVLNRGSILAANYAVQVQGENSLRIDNNASVSSGFHGLWARYGADIEIINSGDLNVVGGNGSNAIFADASDSFRQLDASVSVTNGGSILLEAAASSATGIYLSSTSGRDGEGQRYRGDAELANTGAVTGLGAGSGGIRVYATHTAEVNNTGAINVLGTGVTVGSPDAHLVNTGSISAALGISMSGTHFSDDLSQVSLDNYAGIDARGNHAIEMRGRVVNLINEGDLSSQGSASTVEMRGFSYLGNAVAMAAFNSGTISAERGTAIDMVASNLSGTQASLSLTNQGGIQAGAAGIQALAQSGLLIDNSGVINSVRQAIYAGSGGSGGISVFNSADLTAVGDVTRSIGILAEREISAGVGNAAEVRVANSGRIQAANVGIEASNLVVGDLLLNAYRGDAVVVNEGDLFTGFTGIEARANRGVARIDNSGAIAADGPAVLEAVGAQVVVDNRGSLTGDNRDGIHARASGIDSNVDIANSGGILLNDKSRNGAGIHAEVLRVPDGSNSGLIRVVNSGDIVSTGIGNRGIRAIARGDDVTVTSDALLSAQHEGIDVLSRDGAGDISIVSAGSIASSERSGIFLRSNNGGSIRVDNSAAIDAFAKGIQAAAPQGGSVEIVNRGAIRIGDASYAEYISYNNTGYLVDNAAIYALGNNVRIENHGLLEATPTSTSRRRGISVNSAAAGGIAEVENHGDILMDQPGFSSGYGITVSVGSNGSATLSNLGNVSMGDSEGALVAGAAGAQLAVYNDGEIRSRSAVALNVAGPSSVSSRTVNDKAGLLFSQSNRAFQGSSGSDHLINAGVIRSDGSGSFAAAAFFGNGDDIMEMIGLSEAYGRVDGGFGIDTLRWGGDVLDRFDMGLVGDQYINFERFEKTGSSVWIYDGISTAISDFQVREGVARINGALNSDVRVHAGAILGGTGQINGAVVIEEGAVYAPGASIGSQTLENLTLAGAASVFQLELDTGGQFDQVTVTDSALLDGVLEILFLDTEGFEVGWRAEFLTAGNLLGEFNDYRVLGISGLAQFDIFYSDSGVELVLTAFDAAPVPLPAAFWLFGSALVLLSTRRR